MAYSPRNANGQATAANSAPVTLASDQTQDVLVTGAASQSTSGNNILLATAGSGSVDTMAGAAAYRTAIVQVVASSGIASGQIIFEGSNDGTNFVAVPQVEETLTPTSKYPSSVAFSVAANANRVFFVKITMRYLRCRISTAFSGGTVQAFTRYTYADVAPNVVTIGQSNYAGLNAQAQVVPYTGSSTMSGTSTASTNAANIKSSAGYLTELTLSNPTATAAYMKIFNNAGTPTVGTDSPVINIPIPANSFQSFQFGILGKRFGTGIAVCITGAASDFDTSNAVAGVRYHGTYS